MVSACMVAGRGVGGELTKNYCQTK